MSSGFWSTISNLAVAVPIAGLIGAGISALVLGGMDYGQLRSSLATEIKRNTEMSKYNDEYRKENEKWRDGYAKLGSELSLANASINRMRSDQCESIRSDISDLQAKIERAYEYNSTNEMRSGLQIMMQQHQTSLQACFAARR
ncbi:hypothetical protein L6218_12175 [Pseudomonas syringae pv. syringae]|uniref:hypothetical protein n=1 Tax=Pseudomonas TaxID=286 RepID=UPI0006B916B7|nr:hypothetical protein [Pseudomonas syringae]MCF5550623.1 hypothetical protein [Pseudomonas syringae]MCH5498841.1 hypothetical protein [Pseudomonas syringae pv. syringae]MCH5525132.1 hypothetical protein [Pseudomonas syringae pv. syringae]MCH5560216.1 hypothetical protein [Pseudomonas syringae pv. syringae]MCH5565309.1 hypothetical protein [Pseudomonas syringae pv. syringae]